MNKCNFCPNSQLNNKTGRLECPYRHCWLSKDEIKEILKAIGGKNK